MGENECFDKGLVAAESLEGCKCWEQCGLSGGTPPGVASCEGFCGGQAAAGCFCDDLCTAYGDCCPDAVELVSGWERVSFDKKKKGLVAAESMDGCKCWEQCGLSGGAPPGVESCEGFCGGQASAGCFCDDLCTFYNDCCPDAVDLVSEEEKVSTK